MNINWTKTGLEAVASGTHAEMREFERDAWAREALEMMDRTGQDYYTMRSGDSLVVAVRYGDEISIYDTVPRRIARLAVGGTDRAP